MSIAIVTGSGGLIGAETVKLFAERGLEIVGIDNDMRSQFFGAEASTRWQSSVLQNSVRGFTHYDVDIRDETAINKVFARHGNDVAVIIHCAAQPSHDWAATNPQMDFTVTATAPYTNQQAFAFSPHLQLPYSWQWNVGVEQALGRKQANTVSYVGAAERRLLQKQRRNVSTANPDFGALEAQWSAPRKSNLDL